MEFDATLTVKLVIESQEIAKVEATGKFKISCTVAASHTFVSGDKSDKAIALNQGTVQWQWVINQYTNCNSKLSLAYDASVDVDDLVTVSMASPSPIASSALSKVQIDFTVQTVNVVEKYRTRTFTIAIKVMHTAGATTELSNHAVKVIFTNDCDTSDFFVSTSP